MFDFFKSRPADQQAPAWVQEMQENRTRWFAFLDKLEARMQELGAAAVPELKSAFDSEAGLAFRHAYHNMVSGVKGQYSQIWQKVREVKEEKVHDFFSHYSRQVSFDSPWHNELYEYRNICSERENQFEQKYNYWIAQIDATATEDLEQRYRDILNEYEAIKDKFHCSQCGAQLVIPKMFFISTYIACSYCNTQNTFEPSSQARMLEHLGRSLAEQRTKPLLDAYYEANNKERELYTERHKLDLSLIQERDSRIVRQKREQIAELEKQRQQIIADAPGYYEKYLRAMFDEWHKIVPDLKEHNERFYESQLTQFRARQ